MIFLRHLSVDEANAGRIRQTVFVRSWRSTKRCRGPEARRKPGSRVCHVQAGGPSMVARLRPRFRVALSNFRPPGKTGFDVTESENSRLVEMKDRMLDASMCQLGFGPKTVYELHTRLLVAAADKLSDLPSLFQTFPARSISVCTTWACAQAKWPIV